MTTNWINPPEKLTLSKNEIHIWKVLIDSHLEKKDYYYTLLSDDEKEKADRFYFEKDRNRYRVARGVLRILLGRYLQKTPERINFAYAEYGKPYIADNTEGLFFNLSHSNNIVLYAFGFIEQVGVDVEYHNDRTSYREISRRFFSDAEIKQIFALPEDQHKQAFFDCWSRKEAYIKAKGKGLAIPLGDFSVNVLPDKAELLIGDEPGEEVSEWLMKPIYAEQDYSAALAVKKLNISASYFLL